MPLKLIKSYSFSVLEGPYKSNVFQDHNIEYYKNLEFYAPKRYFKHNVMSNSRSTFYTTNVTSFLINVFNQRMFAEKNLL